MARIVWTIQAADDLENIFEFISKDSVKYARLQIMLIRDRIRSIKRYPGAGRIVPEVGVEEIREIISGSYRIIYQFNQGDFIEILTIHHTARLLKINK